LKEERRQTEAYQKNDFRRYKSQNTQGGKEARRGIRGKEVKLRQGQ
jgi:hypothetical protein